MHARRLGSARHQGAAAVVQRGGLHHQLAGGEGGIAMIDAAGLPGERAWSDNAAAGARPGLHGQRQPLRAGVDDAAVGIDHCLRLQLQRGGIAGQHAALVVQQPRHLPGARSAAAMAQIAGAVAQRLRLQVERVGDAEAALIVDQRAQVQIGIALHLQRSCAVAQIATHLQRRHAQLAGTIVQASGRRQAHRAAVADAATVVVQQSSDVQRAGGQRRRRHRALAARGRCWTASAVGAGAGVVVGVGARVVAPRSRTAAIARGRGGECTDAAAGTVAGAAGSDLERLHAGLRQRAALVAQAGGVDLQPLRIQRAAAVVQVRRGADAQLARGAEGAAVGDSAAGRDLRVLLRLQGTGVFEPAIDGDHQFAGLRTEIAGIAHAHAVFVADQPDLVGEHAAERADIQRERGCLAISSLRGDAAVIGTDHVVAQGGLQLVGPNAGIDLQRAGDQVGVVGPAGIQAGAADLDRAAADPVALQRATGEDRRAGGQGDPAGIEEAAAIDLDAGGIGDDDFGTLAGHLEVAIEPTGRPVDLVEDDLGAAGGQPRIALHPAAQLGLGLSACVVENRPFAAHIELRVAVTRHACGGGCGDVDQRHPVGRGHDRRALVSGRCGSADDPSSRLRLCGVDQADKAERAEHGKAQRCDRGMMRAGSTGTCTATWSTYQLRRHLPDAQCAVEDQTVDAIHVTNPCGCLITPGQAEAEGGVVGRKIGRLFERGPYKGVQRNMLPATAQAQTHAGQVIAGLKARGLTADVPDIDTQIRFQTAADCQAQVVAERPAAIAAQARLAIEATHREAPADREAILRCHRCAIPLRAPGRAVAQVLIADLKRHDHLRICHDELDTRGALQRDRRIERVRTFFRGAQGVECTGTAPISQAGIERDLAEKLAMVQAQLPTGGAPSLHLDLGIVDGAGRLPPPTAAIGPDLDGRVAEHQAVDARFCIAATAAVRVGFDGASNGLAVIVGTCGRAEQPIAVRNVVVHGPTVGVLAGTVEHAFAQADVEQLVESERIVQRERAVGLQLAGRIAAGIVQAQGGAETRTLLPGDGQIAFAWLCALTFGRCNLDICRDRRHALEVFQALLDVAQVEQLTAACWHCVGNRGPRRGRLAEARGMQTPWHQRQRQDAAGEVLWGRQHARGDVAACNDCVLHPLHHQIDAVGTETAPGCRIILGVGRGQGPTKVVCARTIEHDALDQETGRFVLGQTFDAVVGCTFQAHIRPRFLLFTQDALTLLLAQ